MSAEETAHYNNRFDVISRKIKPSTGAFYEMCGIIAYIIGGEV